METIAENTNDAIVSPLFYLIFLGPVGGVFIKSVNTMDSMVGYKNKRYKDFGFFSAKIDDLFFFYSGKNICYLNDYFKFLFLEKIIKMQLKIFKRDRFNHKSPNSAQSESVCAGALDIQLAGDAYYKGVLYKKPFIGDKNREVEIEDINRAIRLLYCTSALAFIIFLSILILWSF